MQILYERGIVKGVFKGTHNLFLRTKYGGFFFGKIKEPPNISINNKPHPK